MTARDIVWEFLRKRTTDAPGHSVSTRALTFVIYGWARSRGYQPPSRQGMYSALRAAGYTVTANNVMGLRVPPREAPDNELED